MILAALLSIEQRQAPYNASEQWYHQRHYLLRLPELPSGLAAAATRMMLICIRIPSYAVSTMTVSPRTQLDELRAFALQDLGAAFRLSDALRGQAGLIREPRCDQIFAVSIATYLVRKMGIMEQRQGPFRIQQGPYLAGRVPL